MDEKIKKAIRVASARAKNIFDKERWTWGIEQFVPTVEQIEETFMMLYHSLQKVKKVKDTYAATGRLRVIREHKSYYDKENEVHYEYTFVVELGQCRGTMNR